MRVLLPIVLVLAMSACSPPPPPASSTATPPAANPRDPLERAKAVEPAVMEQKEQQDEQIEKQGG
jgi:hypothetical protein